MFSVTGVMGRYHTLLPLLRQHLASLSLTVAFRDSGCQRPWGMLVYQLGRGAIWDFDHLREEEGKLEVVFSIYAPSFPPVEAA